MTMPDLDLVTFSSYSIVAYRKMQEAERPIDKKITKAKFDGICIAADSLGLAMTQTDYFMRVKEVVDNSGPRPPYMAVNNKVQQEFDKSVAKTLAVVTGSCIGIPQYNEHGFSCADFDADGSCIHSDHMAAAGL